MCFLLFLSPFLFQTSPELPENCPHSTTDEEDLEITRSVCDGFCKRCSKTRNSRRCLEKLGETVHHYPSGALITFAMFARGGQAQIVAGQNMTWSLFLTNPHLARLDAGFFLQFGGKKKNHHITGDNNNCLYIV